MTGYRLIYSLRIEHDYFDQSVCPVINLVPKASATDLMRRRGLMFKQTGINEWGVIRPDSNAAFEMFSDTLILEMNISDAAFLHYTVWEGFKPTTPYRLSLPSNETDATKAIQLVDSKRRINSGFCTIELTLTNDAPCDTLKFCSKEMYWEYFFILPNSEEIGHREFILIEADSKISFSAFEPTEIYGHIALRCRSKNKIKMRSNYEFRLSLEEKIENSSGIRKTLMKNIPHPIPGNFVSKQEDALLNICYL